MIHIFTCCTWTISIFQKPFQKLSSKGFGIGAFLTQFDSKDCEHGKQKHLRCTTNCVI